MTSDALRAARSQPVMQPTAAAPACSFPGSVEQRLVDSYRELVPEIRIVGQQLDHEHGDQPLRGVDAVRGSVGPTPSPRTHGLHAVAAITLDCVEAEPHAVGVLAAQLADL